VSAAACSISCQFITISAFVDTPAGRPAAGWLKCQQDKNRVQPRTECRRQTTTLAMIDWQTLQHCVCLCVGQRCCTQQAGCIDFIGKELRDVGPCSLAAAGCAIYATAYSLPSLRRPYFYLLCFACYILLFSDRCVQCVVRLRFFVMLAPRQNRH